jgi:hypothetical protein
MLLTLRKTLKLQATLHTLSESTFIMEEKQERKDIYRFCREVICVCRSNNYKLVYLLGTSPQTPWVGFAKVWVANALLRSRTNAFASFLEKKKISRYRWSFKKAFV